MKKIVKNMVPNRPDMFDGSYQRGRLQAAKEAFRADTGLIGSCNRLFWHVFKHLIHIFVVILIISFIFMLVIVER